MNLSSTSGNAADDPRTIVYEYRPGRVYLNITNRCTNACRFCAVRINRGWLGPFNLNLSGHSGVPIRVHPASPATPFFPCDGARGDTAEIVDPEAAAALQHAIDREPETDTILAHLEPFLCRKETPVREVVFCGCGEPLIRLPQVVEVAEAVKRRGVQVRVNTNGQAGLVHGVEAPSLLKGAVDAISISLNAHDARTYQRLSRPAAGEAAFKAILDFCSRSVEAIGDVTLSVVVPAPGESRDWGGEPDVEACAAIADRLGARFRAR